MSNQGSSTSWLLWRLQQVTQSKGICGVLIWACSVIYTGVVWLHHTIFLIFILMRNLHIDSIVPGSIAVPSALCDSSLSPVSLAVFAVNCFFKTAILPSEHLFVWGNTPFLLSAPVSQFQLRSGICNQVTVSPSMFPFHSCLCKFGTWCSSWGNEWSYECRRPREDSPGLMKAR